MKKTTTLLAIIVCLAASSAACMADGHLLRSQARDFYADTGTPPLTGIEKALTWEIPPDMGKRVSTCSDIAFLPFVGEETPRFMNDSIILSPATLTENVDSTGQLVTVEAEGISNSLSAVVAPRTLVNITYYQFEVHTQSPTVNQTKNFRAVSLGARQQFRVSKKPDITGLGEYRYYENSHANMHYLLVGASAPLGRWVTMTLGAAYLEPEEADTELDVVGGLRVSLTPSLQLFGVYNGVDPVKHMYNDHLLALVPAECVDCARENMAAGLSWRVGENIALNLYSYDITDLSIPAGSIYYVVKEK